MDFVFLKMMKLKIAKLDLYLDMSLEQFAFAKIPFLTHTFGEIWGIY